MKDAKILIVDDDLNICELLRLYLQKDGFQTVVVNDGTAAVEAAKNEAPDLILLDIMLPKMDGWQVCREIRKTSTVPIIMLTAKGETFDKILGLELGADDYVTKPFSIPELMARVKAQLRRVPEPQDEKEFVFEDIRMDLSTKKVYRGENYIHLGPTEFRLLRMLMETPGKVYSREYLLKTVWGDNIYVESRTVDVHIRRLRKSLNQFGPDYIRTVRATGYSIDRSDSGENEE